MTRVTNFGIKRKYVQAGFSNEEVKGEGADEKRTQEAEKDEGVKSTGPPKKKRKRDRHPRANKLANADTEIGNENDRENKTKESARQVGESGEDEKPGAATEFKKDNRTKKNELKKAQRKASSEHRRLKRIESKKADITCFVCRERGHAAKECQKVGGSDMGQQGQGQGRSVVGICYRCGSRRHNLSRCKKPADPFNPLPFASCFVCHKKGHLTSTCPENKEKGVYPNGGSCKLCGETSHLAKDCGLRQQDSAKTAMVLGTGTDAGADEDDFHTLNRKKRDVDQEEKQGEEKKRLADNTKDHIRKKERTTALVVQAVLHGFRVIDTACQPKHYREDLVGEALSTLYTQHSIKREDIFLQTKFTPTSGQDQSKPLPYDAAAPIRTQILASLSTSLSNLRTSYIDSYLLHSPLPTLHETIEAWRTLMHLQDSGKVKLIGVSNAYDVRLLAALSKERKVDVVQNRWYEGNGWDRQVLEFCKEMGTQYQSFWTLTGSPGLVGHWAVRRLAEGRGLTQEQVVYAFVMRMGVVPISGTTSEVHMDHDVSVGDVKLGKTDEEEKVLAEVEKYVSE